MASLRQQEDVEEQHVLMPKTEQRGDPDQGPVPYHGIEGLGEEQSKPYVDWKDALVLAVSVTACVIASSIVVFDSIAWHLGYNTQLIIIGLMVSVMALCLKSAAPSFLLRIEARFGQSTLQNFDGIRVNSVMATDLAWHWRLVVLFLLGMPPALGALYKIFNGGEARRQVLHSSDWYNEQWGMFAPPGLAPLGWNTGLFLMFNISTAFVGATTNRASRTDATYGDPANDLPLPDLSKAQPYGFNLLLLNETAAALLDAPPPDWILGVQARLGELDAVEIKADVLGTVAAHNNSIDGHRSRDDDWWLNNFVDNSSQRSEEEPPDMDYQKMPFYNGWDMLFWTNVPSSFDDHDQSWLFLSINPVNASFYEWTKMFTTSRRSCRGTWRIAKNSVQLTDGRCDDALPSEVLDDRSQLIVQRNLLSLPNYYIPVLNEVLAPFTPLRNQSQWLMPSMAAAVASMYWSRIAAMNGPSSPHWEPAQNTAAGCCDTYGFQPAELGVPPENVAGAGLLYRISTTEVFVSRPAMRKSPWLFVVLAVQPVSTLAILLLNLILYQVPVGRDFGLVAILAGVKQDSLALLHGAAFSAKLKQPVHVGIAIGTVGPDRHSVSYDLSSVHKPIHGRVEKGRVYA